MSLVMPSFSESSQQQKRLENERWMQFVGERTGTLRLWLQTHHFTHWVDKEFIQQELQWNCVAAYRDHTYWPNFNTYSLMRFFTPAGLCRLGSQSSLDDFKHSLNISSEYHRALVSLISTTLFCPVMWTPCSTSGVSESGLGGLSSITAASVIIWETLVTSPSHQLQILGCIFHHIQGFHPEHLPAAGVRKIDGACYGIGGEVILMSRAVAERRRREEDAQVNKAAEARELSIRNIM